MSKSIKYFQHEEGDIEAIRENADSAWDILFPWGDRRIFGSVSELKLFVINEIAEYDEDCEND